MYAVITGASSGFGKEFARQFAKLNFDLCIIARRFQKLLDLKLELEKEYNVSIDVLSADLSLEEDMIKAYNFTKNKDVDILINNAGILAIGMPLEISLRKEMKMLDIDVKTVHYMTRLFLPDMIKKNSGKILNVSSLSGWLPVPSMSAYAAGKAYVLHFSEGINFELKRMRSNVRVVAVTPDYFNTSIASSNGIRMKSQGRSVSEFIEKVVGKFLNGKEVILIGQDYKIIFLIRLFPRNLARFILYKINKSNLRLK